MNESQSFQVALNEVAKVCLKMEQALSDGISFDDFLESLGYDERKAVAALNKKASEYTKLIDRFINSYIDQI